MWGSFELLRLNVGHFAWGLCQHTHLLGGFLGTLAARQNNISAGVNFLGNEFGVWKSVD